MRYAMLLWVIVAAIAVVGPGLGDRRVQAYPQPSMVAKSWEFTFTIGKPQVVPVRMLDGEFRYFWYLPYKVVNNTDQERLFFPEVVLATDGGQIIPAGRNVPANAFDVIKAHQGNPLLESPNTVVGRILIGPDAAKESVIVWPAFEKDVDDFCIFVAGLSGETQVIPHPLTGEDVVLRKTLKIDMKMPGTGGIPRIQTLEVTGQSWVMR